MFLEDLLTFLCKIETATEEITVQASSLNMHVTFVPSVQRTKFVVPKCLLYRGSTAVHVHCTYHRFEVLY